MRDNKTSNTITDEAETIFIFACMLIKRMDSRAFLLVFFYFHVIWSKLVENKRVTTVLSHLRGNRQPRASAHMD